MSKKITISRKKERVVLSELLPYETPVIFSNRFFYSFLLENEIEYINGKFIWKHNDTLTDTAIKLMLGIDSYSNERNRISAKHKESGSIPFVYRIKHKEEEYRELAIIHPRKQVMAVDFYDKFKEKIIYHAKKSKFSLRYPDKIATSIYLSKKTKALEINKSRTKRVDENYRIPKHFFVYKTDNYHKFYESPNYHRCEKQYNKMLKLDIAKCFDSIYTHSIAWALIDKEIVKTHLAKIGGMFADKFDRFMQNKNYNETNGILIGSELSRIFAELILQDIDNKLLLKLRESDIFYKKDYEVFRYVDDYVVFFNDEYVRSTIVKYLQFYLKEYKLSLNINKMVLYEKPIITELSIAKKQIEQLLSSVIKYLITTEIANNQEDEIKTGRVSINSTTLSRDFKAIVKTCNVKYREVINYAFEIIERKIDKIHEEYLTVKKDQKTEKNLIDSMRELVNFCFFIYTVSPRVSPTIRLSIILKKINDFTREVTNNKDLERKLHDSIFSNIHFILTKNSLEEDVEVETLYLLLVISDLGRHYWLDDTVLSNYFRTDNMNYFTITTALFYMKDKVRYNKLRNKIVQIIKNKFQCVSGKFDNNTELTLLFFDTLSCPYISCQDKKDIMQQCSIPPEIQTNLTKLRDVWFINWIKFDLRKELDSKRSLEVY